MNLTGQIQGMAKDLETGETLITFKTKNNVGDEVNELKGKDLDITVDVKREKRSKDANAYMWQLCTLIADRLNDSKDTIYKQTILETNVFQDLALEDKAVKTFIHVWEHYGLGYQTQILYEEDGHTCIRAYYGSSDYNTKQMSRLISLLEEDAKALGITILSEREKSLLLEEYYKKWEAKTNDK